MISCCLSSWAWVRLVSNNDSGLGLGLGGVEVGRDDLVEYEWDDEDDDDDEEYRGTP